MILLSKEDGGVWLLLCVCVCGVWMGVGWCVDGCRVVCGWV